MTVGLQTGGLSAFSSPGATETNQPTGTGAPNQTTGPNLFQTGMPSGMPFGYGGGYGGYGYPPMSYSIMQGHYNRDDTAMHQINADYGHDEKWYKTTNNHTPMNEDNWQGTLMTGGMTAGAVGVAGAGAGALAGKAMGKSAVKCGIAGGVGGALLGFAGPVIGKLFGAHEDKSSNSY